MNEENEELQKRYDVLFEMYVEHIHEHRLGVGKTCEDCIRLANKEIERRLKEVGNEST